MTMLLGDVKRNVLRILGDPTGAAYTDEIIRDGVIAALYAMLPWVPKVTTTTFAGDGATKTFVLPVDLHEVDFIEVLSSSEVIAKAILAPGKYHGDYIAATNDWLLYPTGSISFSKAIPEGETYTMYYLKFWTVPPAGSTDSYVLEPPDRTLTAIIMYTCAHCLMASAVTSADVRQWNIRTDSGVPEQNPVQRMVEWFLKMFNLEMSRYSSFARSQV